VGGGDSIPLLLGNGIPYYLIVATISIWAGHCPPPTWRRNPLLLDSGYNFYLGGALPPSPSPNPSPRGRGIIFVISPRGRGIKSVGGSASSLNGYEISYLLSRGYNFQLGWGYYPPSPSPNPSTRGRGIIFVISPRGRGMRGGNGYNFQVGRGDSPLLVRGHCPQSRAGALPPNLTL